MKNPNGYGSITKLSGSRRKPWRVRRTVGWEIDEETGKSKQLFQNIGYYKSRPEAIQALADYNADPFDVKSQSITFAEVYDKWSAEKFDNISKSNANGYKASYSVCKSLYDTRFVDIRKAHLQGVVDSCGKNYPTLRKLKVLFNQLFRYAMENDICSKDYSNYIDIVKHKEKCKNNKHKPFTENEIKNLWDNVERNEYLQIPLILIYSGVRISELLDLKKTDVHLEQRYFDVIESKTDAGIRKVPIAQKVFPFFQQWMEKSSEEFLLNTPDGSHFTYNNYYNAYWKPLMEDLFFEHLPHDTRHTTISMLAKSEINQTIIKRIVGHSGTMSLTEKVYTHFEIQQLIDAIDTI